MNHLSIFDFEQIIFNERQYNLTHLKENKLQESFSFLKRFSIDKIIYGINHFLNTVLFSIIN